MPLPSRLEVQQLMHRVVLLAIRGYQRFVSPHKAFCCAYRVHTGRASCSALGYRAIERYGVVWGVQVLNRRLQLCGVAHRRYSTAKRRPPVRQRGDCDPGCDAPCDSNCDIPNGNRWGSCAGDASSSCDCSGRDSKRRRNTAEDEAKIYIPPYTKFIGAGGNPLS